MSQEDYTKQLEETIESLHKKLDEVSYFKPMWCEEIIPGNGNGKMWVLQLQGNPFGGMYKKKMLSYKRGTPKQRQRWARATIVKEIMCFIRSTGDNRYVPYIFGKEYEWQPSFDECKKYVNRIVFGVDTI
jgi:hypothetical protein